jgi:hypothetical protein
MIGLVNVAFYFQREFFLASAAVTPEPQSVQASTSN